jgi:hypothetical protein
MNCHDARERISAQLRGGIGLTEWVLAETHVRQCVECRKELEHLQQAMRSHQRVAPSRALLHGLSKIVDAIHFGTTSVAAWLTRLRVLLSIPLTVSGQTAVKAIEGSRVGAMWLVSLLTRVRWLLPILVSLSVRASASVIGAMRLLITHVADLLARLRLSSLIAFQWTARAAANVIGAGRFVIIRFAPLPARLRVLLAMSFTVSVQAAGRVIAAGRVGAVLVVGLLLRVRWLLLVLVSLSERIAVKAIGATWVVSTTRRRDRSNTTSETISGSARPSPLWPRVNGTRALLGAGSGIVSLAVLVATILLLGPRQWPDHLAPRPSRGERSTQDVRAPADRKAAELAPAAVSAAETQRVAMRPKPPETRAEIPAPWRSPDPTLAPRNRAPASAPTLSTEASWSRGPARPKESARARDVAGSQNAEASDPSAVIDWLLKGGNSPRRIESP